MEPLGGHESILTLVFARLPHWPLWAMAPEGPVDEIFSAMVLLPVLGWQWAVLPRYLIAFGSVGRCFLRTASHRYLDFSFFRLGFSGSLLFVHRPFVGKVSPGADSGDS